MARATRIAAIAALCACGCTSESGSPDAGSGDAAADGAASGPIEPALPILTRCPTGWREVALPEGVAACDPWPEGDLAPCADGEAWLPGARSARGRASTRTALD